MPVIRGWVLLLPQADVVFDCLAAVVTEICVFRHISSPEGIHGSFDIRQARKRTYRAF